MARSLKRSVLGSHTFVKVLDCLVFVFHCFVKIGCRVLLGALLFVSVSLYVLCDIFFELIYTTHIAQIVLLTFPAGRGEHIGTSPLNSWRVLARKSEVVLPKKRTKDTR